MRRDEFKTPLLQSAVVIIVLLVLFSFVVTSGADGIGSGLTAIITGIVYAALFTIGLIISILLSISLLIFLFLAAIALYSVDKAREIFVQLQSALLRFTDYLAQIIAHRKHNQPNGVARDQARIEHLESQLARAAEQNHQLLATIDELTRKIESLRSTMKENSYDDQAPPAP